MSKYNLKNYFYHPLHKPRRGGATTPDNPPAPLTREQILAKGKWVIRPTTANIASPETINAIYTNSALLSLAATEEVFKGKPLLIPYHPFNYNYSDETFMSQFGYPLYYMPGDGTFVKADDKVLDKQRYRTCPGNGTSEQSVWEMSYHIYATNTGIQFLDRSNSIAHVNRFTFQIPEASGNNKPYTYTQFVYNKPSGSFSVEDFLTTWDQMVTQYAAVWLGAGQNYKTALEGGLL